MKKNIMKKNFFILLFVLVTFWGMSLNVYANESLYPDVEERTNLIEIRLEEYGTSLSEIQERLSGLEVAVEEFNSSRLKLTEQMDILIVGINALYEELCLTHIDEVENSKGLIDLKNEISGLNESTEKMIAITVSGNVAISDLGKTVTDSIEQNSELSLSELTKTLAKTNSMLVKLYCMLIAFVAVILVDILFRFFWKMLFKHAYSV